MTEINLLPWRDNLQKAQQKEFFMIFAITLGLAAFILVLALNRVKVKLQHQQSLNAVLQKNINVLDAKISAATKIENELAQINAQEKELERSRLERNRSVQLLEQISHQIPSGMYLTRFEKKGLQLILEGNSESDALIAKFMQNLTQSPWVFTIHLAEMKLEENKGVYFKLELNMEAK